MSRLIPRTTRRQEKVKNPTLTSNGATLGWGTLGILAGMEDSAHPALWGGPPAPLWLAGRPACLALLAGTDKGFGRDLKIPVKIPDHGERQGPVTTHYFIDAGALPDYPNQGPIVLSLLLQAELDCFHGIRQINGEMLALVGFDQGYQDVENVSLCRAGRCSPQSFNSPECFAVIFFISDGFYPHTSPLPRRCGHSPRGSPPI